MTRILYRPLGEGCAVSLRPITIDESTPRVLPVHRKPAWPHTAIAVDYVRPISVGTLVELDVAFENVGRRFRGRGVVSWSADGTSPDKPVRLGVVIYSLHPWSAEAQAVPVPVVSRREPEGDFEAPESRGAPSTVRQDGPLADSPTSKDMALGATAAMLSPLQPLTASPTIDELGELLTNLLGEEVKVSRAPMALRLQDACLLAEYSAEDGEIAAAAMVDLRLAVYLGSALAMIPASAAEADVKARKLTAEVRDNMKEIFNIATAMVARPNGPHRKLVQVLELGAEQPTGALSKLFAAPPFRYDFEVEVPAYGRGRLTYLSPALQITDDDLAAARGGGSVPARDAVPQTPQGEPSAALAIPDESALADLLTGLVGADVGTTITATPMSSKDTYLIADYVEDDGSVSGVCLADVKIANFLGAALAMIPANAAEKDARAKKLSDEVKDNVQEIFNIGASLFNVSGGAHHRFRRLYLPHKEDLPEEVSAIIRTPAARADFALSVPGYGDGKLAVLSGWARSAVAPAAVPIVTAQGPVEPSSAAQAGQKSVVQDHVLLPESEALGELFTGLVGEEVGVTQRSDITRLQDICLVATWSDDSGLERLLFGFDIKLANHLGAALAMIPPAAAQDEIKAKNISNDVFENVKEICNISSGALNREGAVHLKVSELRRVGPADMPAHVATALQSTHNRLDLEIEVPGYGSGKLVIAEMT